MNQKGITLIEMVVAMAIAAVIGGIVFSVFLNMNRTVIDQNSVVDVQSAGRNAMGSMVRILRETGLDPLGTADAGVEIATATKLRMTRDANLNGVIEDGLQERITFEFSGGSLRRGYDEGTASESWTTMSDDVLNLTFTYLDAENDPVTDPFKVRVIIFNLTLRDDKSGGGNFTRSLTTTVQGRNL